MMDKVIGGVIRKHGIQIGKLLDVLKSHPVIDPNL